MLILKKGISKSKYVSFCRCKKQFWLNIYAPEKKEIDAATQSRLAMGNVVGDLAMRMFGNYIDVTYLDEKNQLDLKKMCEETKKLMDAGYENICEASFLIDGLYCAVDILHKGASGYEIYEVKSTTEVEPYHKVDTSFQRFVLRKLGISIEKCYVVHLNNKYVLKNELNIQELFTIVDVTDEVAVLEKEVERHVDEALKVLNSSEEPTVMLSKNCDKPFQCEFKKYCFKDIPKNSVFDLSRNTKKYQYYQEGIITFKDIYNSKYFAKLTRKNQIQIEHELFNKELICDKEKVQLFLDNLKYPLYFLDFETTQMVIPIYEGTRPYEQIPFQYSLHYLEKPNAELKHLEFLAKADVDPRYALAKQLVEDIKPNGTIIAYNMSFEKTVIRNLSYTFSTLRHDLQMLLDHFVDLMLPFSNYDIYTKEFQGSYSIKYVLPALFPDDQELNYHNLDIIHNGSEAMNIFASLSTYSEEEQERIRHALLKYCELDTYAMVKIFYKLQELVR